MRKIIDLTGQKFGQLTVIEKTDKKASNGSIIWHCKCECGNEKDVRGDNLKNGHIRSCGCLKNENLIGQTFGKLTVIKKVGILNNNSTWLCQCECGNITIVMGSRLKNGNTKSCGCLGRSTGEFLIDKILKENNISFQREFRFQDCKDKYPLPFDFYVDNKYIIEFDGLQHFKYQVSENSWNTQDHFEKTQKHDQIKNQWCKDNNIPLIRIPYTHLDDLCLEDLLLETSKFIVV